MNYGRPSQQGLPSTFHPSEGVFPLISNKWGGESQLQLSAPAPAPPQIPYVDISHPRQPIPSSSTHNYIPLLEHVRTFSARRERPSPLSLSTVPPNKTPLSRSRAFTVSGPEVSGEVPPIGVKGSALPEDNTRYQLSPSPPDRGGFGNGVLWRDAEPALNRDERERQPEPHLPEREDFLRQAAWVWGVLRSTEKLLAESDAHT